jgi:subtilisin family serine protease
MPRRCALRAAGIFVAASAGNDGDACGSVAAPIGTYDAVFSVGAVDSAGRVASFSSRGPVTVDGSERIKPDIVAPGVEVLSAWPGGGYATVDGTSMAAPHVAGAVALLWSANPALVGDVEATGRAVSTRMRSVAVEPPACGDASNVAGAGLLDAYAAVRAALAAR